MGFKDIIYSKTPYFIQKRLFDFYCRGLYKSRYGARFDSALNELREMEKWTYSDLLEYQNEKLKKLIRHCYETVPYYFDVMNETKIKPSDIKNINDLEKFPILTRDIVRENKNRLISSKYRQSALKKGHTSGTTGSPLEFYWDEGMWFWNNVFDWRQKEWGGMKRGDPSVIILGRAIVPEQKEKAPFWQFNRFENQLWVSAFHLSEKYIPEILDEIEKFSPKFLEGYPSTVSILAKMLQKNNKLLDLNATFTSSEPLLDEQKKIMSSVFKCENFDYYGLAERVIWATECEYHNGRHLNMEYGITEVVDQDNNRVGPGSDGFLVGTSLLNFGMPFIRYKTTDISKIHLGSCKCGRNYPLMDAITTKAEDLIHSPSGKMISSSVLTHPFKPMKCIEKSQIVQERIDLLRVKIVRRDCYSDEDTKKLIKSLSERVGHDMEIKVDFVEDIPREKSGKFKWVISKLDRKVT